ncbi:MAG: hypothetical protein M3126_03055 [Candidatus Eremiobacteraeota bacterium]|nr:hypothetical protein [Candidatus Eremiobacteraeota bacterium]
MAGVRLSRGQDNHVGPAGDEGGCKSVSVVSDTVTFGWQAGRDEDDGTARTMP